MTDASRPDGRRVLLVEDSPSDAALACEALRRAGLPARCHRARTVADALAYLGEHPPPRVDLLLVDLSLPVRSGFALLADLAEADPPLLPAATPIVVLSASNDPEDARRAYAAGATEFCSKPLTFDGLVDLLRHVVKRWAPPP